MKYTWTFNTKGRLIKSLQVLSVLQAYTLSFLILLLLILTSVATAENKPGHTGGMKRGHEHVTNPKTLSGQIEGLSQQTQEIQNKINKQGLDSEAMKANGDLYRSKSSMGSPGTAPIVNALPPVAPIAPIQAQQMGMMAGMKGMMNSMMGGGMNGGAPMGEAGGMGPSSFYSELPGFPGASHLYHIGSTNFFLDHPQHITLSLEQQNRLGQIRTKALLKRSDFNRKIQEVEEQIWLLTAADQPILKNIELKIRESEKLQGDSRIAYIKEVGEAAMLLSDDQRGALLGQVSYPALPTVPNDPQSKLDQQKMGDM